MKVGVQKAECQANADIISDEREEAWAHIDMHIPDVALLPVCPEWGSLELGVNCCLSFPMFSAFLCSSVSSLEDFLGRHETGEDPKQARRKKTVLKRGPEKELHTMKFCKWRGPNATRPHSRQPHSSTPKLLRSHDQLLQLECTVQIRGPRVANPPTPYSVQKRPEPQICPKFVAAIVSVPFKEIEVIKLSTSVQKLSFF